MVALAQGDLAGAQAALRAGLATVEPAALLAYFGQYWDLYWVLDQLEPLLRMPYYLSPGWLRIDPTFAPLKGNPRFEKLVASR